MLKQFSLLLIALFFTSAALSHEGHGMEGTHWHATDLWGFLVVAMLVAVVIWQSRK